MKDKALIGTAFNNSFRFYLVRGSNTVNRALLDNNYEFVTADALARSLMLTLTLSLMEKREVVISSFLKGDGPLKNITCSSLKRGTVRGFAEPALISTSPLDNYSVNSAIGKGRLEVVRQYQDSKPYSSAIDLFNSSVTDDYMHFFHKSDQVNTAILYGSLFQQDSFTNVTSLLIQVLPDATDDAIFILEERIKELPKFRELCELSDEEILSEVFIANNFKILEEQEVKYFCNCSASKFLNNLSLLGIKELEELSLEQEVSCVCNFCNKKYTFKQSDIKSLLAKKGK